MFIVDPRGKLIIAGAIDDTRGWNPEEVKTAKNLVRAALDESLAGRAMIACLARSYVC